MAKQRDPVLDSMRGIGIVLMVLGHSGFPGTDYIYLFHMALFFMLSGWFFSLRGGLVHFVRRKLVTLWLPFVAANTVFTVCNNLFLRLKILTADARIAEIPGNSVTAPVSIKDIIGRTVHWCVFDGGTQLGGAMWFIQALFQISLLYAVIEVLLQKLLHGGDTLIAQGLLSGVLLWVGWHCNQIGWNVWGLGIAASCYWMFYLGTVLRRTARSEVRPLYRAAAGAAAFVLLLVLLRLGSVGLAGMVANHNGEMSGDGWLPMNAKINGQLHPTDADYADWYARAARGYDSWVEMTTATGLPLAQNTLLDEGDTSTFPSIAMYPSGMIDIPDEYDDGMPYTPKFQEYPAGFIPIGRGDTPDKLYLRTGVLLDSYNVEIMAVAYLGDAPKEMATDLYWQKSAGLTWQCESYPMANGNTALIPHCTSNPNSRPYIQSRAYFAQDGILYQVYCRPYTDSLCYSASQENIWAELKVVLDGFS